MFIFYHITHLLVVLFSVKSKLHNNVTSDNIHVYKAFVNVINFHLFKKNFRYEKELQNEEQAYQQQRRRLYQEVQEEKDRVAQQASRQRRELDNLQRQMEESHRQAISAMKSEFDKAREEQENRHIVRLHNCFNVVLNAIIN